MPIPAVTYVLSTAFAAGVSSAHVAYGSGGQTFDVLAALVAGGGDSKGVGGSFTVTDADIAAALDTYPVLSRSGVAGPPPVTNPVIQQLIASLLTPTAGQGLVYQSDGLPHNADLIDDASGWLTPSRLPPDAINARRYLKGDGTDDTTRLNNLLTAAAGGALVIPGHTDYYIPGQIVVPDAAIQIVMQKGGRFTRNLNDRAWMVGGGTKTVFAGGVLAANAAAGATTLTLTDASTVSAGDRFILRSTLAWPGSSSGVYGEQVRVLSKAGNVVTLYGPIIEAYNTADTARLDRANLREGQHFQGLVFEGVANTGTYGAIDLDFLLTPGFRDLTFRNLDGPGLQLNSPLGARGWGINGFDLQDNVGALRFGYLDVLNGAAQDCTFAAGYSERVRHHYTSAGDSNGVPHGIDLIALRGRYATTTDFDNHEDGRGHRFIGCSSHGSQGAFKLRAPDTELIAPRASGFLSEGINVNSTALRAAISNPQITDNRGTSRGAILSADDVTVNGGLIDNQNAGTSQCVLIEGNNTVMNGTRLRRPGGGTGTCLGFTGSPTGHHIDVICEDAATGVDKGTATPSFVRVRPRNLSGNFIDGATMSGALAQAITVGASPFVWTNNQGIAVDVIITGGTVSQIDRSNNAANYTTTGATVGSFRVEPGATLRVTYSVLPTMKFMPCRG